MRLRAIVRLFGCRVVVSFSRATISDMPLYYAQLPQHICLHIRRGTLDQTSEPPPMVMEQLPQHMCLSIHRGALDQTLVTSAPPPRVMQQIRQVLDDMGVLVQAESEFKYRCICKQPKQSGSDEVSFTITRIYAIKKPNPLSSSHWHDKDRRWMPSTKSAFRWNSPGWTACTIPSAWMYED